MSWYIENLQRSIEQHQRQVDQGTPEAAQAQQIINQHRAEIARVQSSAAPSPSPDSGGGGGYSPPPPPPKPINPWITASNYVEPTGVKQADPDIIITAGEEPLSPELLLELQYEDLAGVELINISRSDIIDGQNVIYSPVKNLASLRRRYNPNNIIALPAVSSSLFSKYAIDLILRIGEDPATGLPYEPYFDENGDLVIEIEDVREDEIVEIEVDSSGTINLVDFT